MVPAAHHLIHQLRWSPFPDWGRLGCGKTLCFTLKSLLFGFSSGSDDERARLCLPQSGKVSCERMTDEVVFCERSSLPLWPYCNTQRAGWQGARGFFAQVSAGRLIFAKERDIIIYLYPVEGAGTLIRRLLGDTFPLGVEGEGETAASSRFILHSSFCIHFPQGRSRYG